MQILWRKSKRTSNQLKVIPTPHQTANLYFQNCLCISTGWQGSKFTVLLLLKHQGCTEGDVRLLEGSTSREGRVEVCRSNMWGTVCHSGWTVEDARVVCRQLGYSVVGKNFYPIYVSIGDHKFPYCRSHSQDWILLWSGYWTNSTRLSGMSWI